MNSFVLVETLGFPSRLMSRSCHWHRRPGWKLQRLACFGPRRGTKKPQLMKLVAVSRINKLWERTEKEDPPEPPSFLLSRGAEGPRADSMPTAPLVSIPHGQGLDAARALEPKSSGCGKRMGRARCESRATRTKGYSFALTVESWMGSLPF